MIKPESCKACPLYHETAVDGDGHIDAKLIIIGQNPGPTEKEVGLPFVGASGRVLDRALSNAMISRSRNYVTNVVKCFVPPGQPVPPKAVELCRPILAKELALLPKAKVILTLGKEAFDELSGKKLSLMHDRQSAEKNPNAWLRGCPLPMADGRIIIPTVHPSFVMRSGFLSAPTFEADVVKARRFAEGTATIPQEHFDHNPSTAQVQEYTRECISLGECGIDIETPESIDDEDDLDPLTQTPVDVIGVSCHLGESIGVQPDQFDLLRPLLDGEPGGGETTGWVYNGGFDYYHLSKRFSLRGIRQADALVAFHILHPELKTKDLATCLSYFSDIPYHKNLRKREPALYNNRDTYGVLYAGREMIAQMKYLGNENLFWNILMPLVDMMTDWRVKGVRSDTKRANQLILMLHMALQKYEVWWDKNVPAYSWSSPKQLIEMFQRQGLPVQMRLRPAKNGKPAKKTPSCDDDALELFATKYNNTTAKLIQTMRTLKHAQDFLDIARPDGWIHPRFKLHGQVGGRIQAMDPDLQNIPEELAGVYPREILLPDHPDDVMLIADFSQIELRIYCWYAKAQKLLDRILSGDYIYGIFYEEIFEEPFFASTGPRIKGNTDPRVVPWKLLVAKSWPLGFIYGRGVPDPGTLPISKAKAKEIQNKFHKDNPEFRIFHDNIMVEATKKGYLQTAFGRIRRFPNAQGQRNEILAFFGQTTTVDVMITKSLLPFKTGLKQFSHEQRTARTLFGVHDSVGVTCPKVHWRPCYDYMELTMQGPIPEMDGFSVPVEIKIGPSWGAAKPREKYLALSNGTA